MAKVKVGADELQGFIEAGHSQADADSYCARSNSCLSRT